MFRALEKEMREKEELEEKERLAKQERLEKERCSANCCDTKSKMHIAPQHHDTNRVLDRVIRSIYSRDDSSFDLRAELAAKWAAMDAAAAREEQEEAEREEFCALLSCQSKHFAYERARVPCRRHVAQILLQS